MKIPNDQERMDPNCSFWQEKNTISKDLIGQTVQFILFSVANRRNDKSKEIIDQDQYELLKILMAVVDTSKKNQMAKEQKTED
jgi:hypothetical protein